MRHFDLNRYLPNHLHDFLLNDLVMNNSLFIQWTLHKFFYHSLHQLLNGNVDILQYFDLSDGFLDHRNFNYPVYLNQLLLDNNPIHCYFDDLRDFLYGFNNSRNNYDLLNNFLNFNNLRYFYNLLNYFVHLDSDFLDSVDINRHFYNPILIDLDDIGHLHQSIHNLLHF